MCRRRQRRRRRRENQRPAAGLDRYRLIRAWHIRLSYKMDVLGGISARCANRPRANIFNTAVIAQEWTLELLIEPFRTTAAMLLRQSYRPAERRRTAFPLYSGPGGQLPFGKLWRLFYASATCPINIIRRGWILTKPLENKNPGKNKSNKNSQQTQL